MGPGPRDSLVVSSIYLKNVVSDFKELPLPLNLVMSRVLVPRKPHGLNVHTRLP